MNIVTSTGHSLPWVDEVRYLGIFMLRARTFKCSLQHAKRSFYRSMNAIFAKVGKIASEEVTLKLVCSKCLPTLLYGLEVCELNNSDKRSLDFVIDRFFYEVIWHQQNRYHS